MITQYRFRCDSYLIQRFKPLRPHTSAPPTNQFASCQVTTSQQDLKNITNKRQRLYIMHYTGYIQAMSSSLHAKSLIIKMSYLTSRFPCYCRSSLEGSSIRSYIHSSVIGFLEELFYYLLSPDQNVAMLLEACRE